MLIFLIVTNHHHWVIMSCDGRSSVCSLGLWRIDAVKSLLDVMGCLRVHCKQTLPAGKCQNGISCLLKQFIKIPGSQAAATGGEKLTQWHH